MLEFLKGPFLVMHLSYINDNPSDMRNIAIYADDTTLYSKCDQASYLRQQLELASDLSLNLTYKTLWTGAGSSLLVSMLEKLS